jgi:antirestriction protein ArdC
MPTQRRRVGIKHHEKERNTLTDTLFPELTVPRNAVTGELYLGKSIDRLILAQCRQGYSGGGWAGFHQWITAGRIVRKGEHGTHCVTVVIVEKNEHGNGKRKPKGFVVFHRDQTDELGGQRESFES